MADILPPNPTAHVLTDDEAQQYVDLGATATQLVRLGFPDANDELADFLLWEKTPFPVARGVHDIVDHVALLVIDGPRCDVDTERAPHYMCRRKVRAWGAVCEPHRLAMQGDV